MLLVVSVLVACGDGDATSAHADRDPRAVEDTHETAPGTAADLDAASADAPQIDASAAFSEWLADSGIPFSAWLGEAGQQHTATASVPALAPDLTRALIGRAYAESTYELREPKALSAAFAAATGLTGDTRLFVTAIQRSDAGAEALYGAADLIDGGLAWQKPPARPRRFALGAGADGSVMSAPFTYVLEARIAGTHVYRLLLEAERATWTATFRADYSALSAELTGAVTREQLEHRSLDHLSCIAACGQNSAAFCNDAGALRLSAALDCNAATPDLDLNGDGSTDAYRLRILMQAVEVQAPRE